MTVESESSSMEQQTPAAPLETQKSNEATTEYSSLGGGTESKAHVISEDESLDSATEWSEKGTKALKDNDFAEAAECFSRALEIRASHYGELAVECLSSYYQYGRALLYKAQEEADPLGAVPKKDGGVKEESDKDGSVKSALRAESSTAASALSSINADEENEKPDSNDEGAADAASGGKDQEEEGESSDNEDIAEGDEDESDLDLAWKMLDVARAIAERHSGDTMDKVDVLSALAEVALEREDIETSLSDYQKALVILERLVEPDSRRLAELNFCICLCLEIGSMPQEAIPYCQKAISICKSRVQRLMNEVKGASQTTTTSAITELDDGIQQSSTSSQNNTSVKDDEEIETLTDLSSELEKKLEDLQQLAVNPKSILSEILGMASAKAKAVEKSESPAKMTSSQIATVSAGSSGGFDSPTVSNAHTNGSAVTHLGVVGRGVKRVLMTPTSTSVSTPAKKPALDPSAEKDNGSH